MRDSVYQTEEYSKRFYPAVSGITMVGLDYIWSLCGQDKPYKNKADLAMKSAFPFHDKTPAIANMTPFYEKGDGSWYKGLSNPRYVEDIDIEYHAYSEISCHDDNRQSGRRLIQ